MHLTVIHPSLQKSINEITAKFTFETMNDANIINLKEKIVKLVLDFGKNVDSKRIDVRIDVDEDSSKVTLSPRSQYTYITMMGGLL